MLHTMSSNTAVASFARKAREEPLCGSLCRQISGKKQLNMHKFFWSFLAVTGFAIVFSLPLSKDVNHSRQKRQGSQMDPLMRRACDNVGNDTKGIAPHPYACGSYLQCFNGTYSEIDCPGNMLFNIKKNTCDFRRLVKCAVIDGVVGDPNDPNFGPETPVQVDHPPLTKSK
ncbi:uncharacterized protein LOC129594326 [Paramacrobiotus metropolitanus]|uniref:uncharacterized protein LOC129594326 n=1 Tax=Paramacrobiotus metropolitanus TaxID=2943436 RepID=UPI002445D145|nr:uncharacterized protein LOC129594326 [Paramacrobiotus metropolitanus]